MRGSSLLGSRGLSDDETIPAYGEDDSLGGPSLHAGLASYRDVRVHRRPLH